MSFTKMEIKSCFVERKLKHRKKNLIFRGSKYSHSVLAFKGVLLLKAKANLLNISGVANKHTSIHLLSLHPATLCIHLHYFYTVIFCFCYLYWLVGYHSLDHTFKPK